MMSQSEKDGEVQFVIEVLKDDQQILENEWEEDYQELEAEASA